MFQSNNWKHYIWPQLFWQCDRCQIVTAENWVQPFGGGLKMLTIRSDNLQAKTVLFMHLMFTIVNYCGLLAISVGRWSKKLPVDKNGAVGQVCMGRIVIGLTKTWLGGKKGSGQINKGLKLKGRKSKINGLLLGGGQISSRQGNGNSFHFIPTF